MNYRLHALSKALYLFEKMIVRYTLKKANNEELDVYQDSIQRRFEISFDLLWKFLKKLLAVEYGVELASPKKVIREATNQGLFTAQEMHVLIKMCDDRNLAAHAYDADYSAELADRVIEYYHKIKPALFKIVEQANE